MMVMYFLTFLGSFQIVLQITYISCEGEGRRSIQNKNSFSTNLKNTDKIVKTNHEDENNVNKHDIKDVNSGMYHYEIHHLQRLPVVVKEHSNLENAMTNDYNDENEENTRLKQKINHPNSHLVMAIEEDKVHSPRYSGLKRNKPGFKGYQNNLENDSRKLHARKAHKQRFNEETIFTDASCVEYKAAPSSSSTSEQTTTDTPDTTLADSNANEDNRNTKTVNGESHKNYSTSELGNKEKLLENEQQNNRNERDTKSIKNSIMHFRDRHEIPSNQRLSKVFKERSNIENTMNYDYNYDNDESPSFRREMGNGRRLVMNTDDKRQSPRYAGLRRNNPGPKDYQAHLENESRKLYARKAHEPRYNEEIIVTGECVDYKAPALRSTTEQATADTTPTACTTNKDNTKTKTIIKGNHKAPPTRNGEVKLLENEELSEYDKYLCGLFADTFVNAVLVKVRRSRKMAKELGFSNESDETCDRCIELKPSKIPDLEPMRASLGKCSKGSDSDLNTSTCQNTMGDFLDLLLLFEKEHENSVYNKIRDDSSFIFTGDYDSSIRKENELTINDKYHNNRDSFSKDFEKQRLRDESTEEKSDDRVPNANYSPGKVKNLPQSYLQHRFGAHDPTDGDVEENEDDEIEAKTKTSLMQSDKEKDTKDDTENKNFIQLETSFNDNDFTESHEQQDLPSPIRRKYSTNKDEKDQEFDGPQYSADTANGNLNKPAKVRSSKDIHSSLREPAHNYGRDVRKHEEGQDQASAYSSKLGQYAEPYSLNQGASAYGNMDHQSRGAKTHIKHNKLRQTVGNTHSRKNNYFGYLPDGYESLGLNDGSRLYSPYDKPKNWEEGEYQLYPNQAISDAEDPLKVRLHQPKYYGSGLDDSLRMVKRDAESYDDDLSGFEIPDIEYELY